MDQQYRCTAAHIVIVGLDSSSEDGLPNFRVIAHVIVSVISACAALFETTICLHFALINLECSINMKRCQCDFLIVKVGSGRIRLLKRA
ncbi:hypothetical protein WQE_16489 [Paraburkholderia hospita]|uniref:Uncharacterized protein n=1 Tax=Paraburkholderia hospita TaxID=169430 RepID=A0ABN0FMF1_9BURK|nr:hypothetical protein WQE_16489 [Paraburkholderia hospita]